jgi:hypothetical protein
VHKTLLWALSLHSLRNHQADRKVTLGTISNMAMTVRLFANLIYVAHEIFIASLCDDSSQEMARASSFILPALSNLDVKHTLHEVLIEAAEHTPTAPPGSDPPSTSFPILDLAPTSTSVLSPSQVVVHTTTEPADESSPGDHIAFQKKKVIIANEDPIWGT